MPLQPEVLLWLANPNDGRLRLVEPRSGSLAVVVPTGARPAQVVVGEGAAWVLDRSADQVLRIRLDDYAIAATIPIPQGETQRLQVGLGYVWVAIDERPSSNVLLPSEEYVPHGGVLRINPQTNQVDGYTAVGPVLDLVTAQGSLWVLSRTVIDTPIDRVDPQTLAASQVELRGSADWQLADCLAVSENSLWLFSQSTGKLYRYSLAGGLYAQFSFGQHEPIGPARLLLQDSTLWLAAPWGALLAIDVGNDQFLGEIALDGPIDELVSAGGVAWAASAVRGLAYQLDPAHLMVSAQLETGPQLAPTRQATATAILRASRPCEDAPYSRLAVGQLVHTQAEPALPQRLHAKPAQDAERTGWIQPSETARILEGPTCAEGQVWWRVETLNGGYQGWAAEGDDADYWLIPGLP
jgi:streptogramin lyase